MTPAEWFEHLNAHISDPQLEVNDTERQGLLDLARVAAHSSERWAAPISTYLVGLAFASMPPDERAEAVKELVEELDAAPPEA